MNKMVVFDIDGVLAKFEPRLVEVLDGEFGSNARVNRHVFSLKERFEKHPEILFRALELVEDPNFYYGLEYDKNATVFLADLASAGFGVMYLTSRPKSSYSFTKRWLSKIAPNSGTNSLFMESDKADFLSDVDVDFVVEDDQSQIEKLKKSGKTVLCWHQEWNEGIFPRLYARSDGEIMYWSEVGEESEPFWSAVAEMEE
jgi:hypothetical protein